MTDVSNTDDVIDSRDVIARIEELEAEREALADEVATTADALADSVETDDTHADAVSDSKEANEALAYWDSGMEGAELAALRVLANEASGYAEYWHHGETLVRDSYFAEYAQQLADDCGLIPSDASWPLTCIDWEQAARELQRDYTSVDFDGVTYWVR
jgi:hypothetical protein